MKLKKNNNFFLGKSRNFGRLYMRRTYSNIFITLTDMNNQVIICKTSGNQVLQVLNVVKKLLMLLKILLNC